MYYVYILKSISRDKYYIGYTANLYKRIEEHNKGCSRWTRSKGKWLLVYYEEFSEKRMALKREREFKKKKSKAYIEYLLRNSKFDKICIPETGDVA